MSPGSMPATRYSSTSSTSAGTRTAMSSRPLAGLDRAELAAEPERPRACRASRCRSDRAARTTGRQPPHLRQLGEHVQIRRRSPGCRCRPRPARPTRRSARSAERRRRSTLLRGQVTSVAPPQRGVDEIRVGHLHAVHGEQPRCRAARADRDTRPARSRAAPGRVPGAERLEQRRATAPVPSRRNSTSSADSPRCTLTGRRMPRRRDRAQTSAGDTEYGACGASDGPQTRNRRQRRAIDPAHGRPAHSGSGAREANQLVKDHRETPAFASGSYDARVLRDVADEHRSRRARLGDRACIDRVCADPRGSRPPRARSASPPTPASTRTAARRPRIHDSSRWVCALTRPGRTATSPRSLRSPP